MTVPAIVTKAHLVAATAVGVGPLAEAADDEPVFVLRAADFESQQALWHFSNTGHHRWRSRDWCARVSAVRVAMEKWFAEHNKGLPPSHDGGMTVVPSNLGQRRPKKPAPPPMQTVRKGAFTSGRPR